MIKLAPSILSADFSDLYGEIKKAEAGGADWLHIDVMDGHFVPNITIGPPVIRCIRGVSVLPFDVHLMIENPGDFIEDFVDAGADILTIHQEASPHLHRLIQSIKNCGIKAGVSINPATPVAMIEPVLEDVDMVLVMSVNPGFGGQEFIRGSLRKIEQLNKLRLDSNLSFDIEVDGGVNISNAVQIVKAGADILVAGSAVYGASPVEERIKQFKGLFL